MFYKYIIKFDGAEEKTIDIELDPATLSIAPKKTRDFPEWALLDCGKCSVCPYDGASHKYCSIALNLADLMKMFSDKASTMTVDARVVTREREYFKRTSLQTALSSAIGIYMVTSGCPVMELLKPMARHHLPFASLNETIHRSISSYLLQQYLKKKEGLEPDWELKHLHKAYEAIEILNLAIVDRIRKFSLKDANYNAIIILDIFTKMVPLAIDKRLPTKEFLHPE
jgi:hypothetical protein